MLPMFGHSSRALRAESECERDVQLATRKTEKDSSFTTTMSFMCNDRFGNDRDAKNPDAAFIGFAKRWAR